MTAFRHDIAGGGGDLIINSVQSPNYVPGTSGWQVRKDGSAELSNVIARGTITSVLGGIAAQLVSAALRWFSVTSPPASPPTLYVGDASTSGAALNVSSGRATAGGTAVTMTLYDNAASGKATAQAVIGQVDNQVAPGTSALLEVQGTIAAPRVTATVGGAAETWRTAGLALPANWTAIGRGIRYRLSPDNSVRIQVNASIGAAAAAGTISLGTLPAGYVPVNPFRGCAPSVFDNGAPGAASFNSRFNVTTAGVVQVLGFPGGANPGGITEFDGQWDVPLD